MSELDLQKVKCDCSRCHYVKRAIEAEETLELRKGVINEFMKSQQTDKSRIKELEEALNKIVNYENSDNFKTENWTDSFINVVDIATKALKGGGKE